MSAHADTRNAHTQHRNITTAFSYIFLFAAHSPHLFTLLSFWHTFFFLYFAGIFFVLPCIETYQKVDLRTITLDVPPQEVNYCYSMEPTRTVQHCPTVREISVTKNICLTSSLCKKHSYFVGSVVWKCWDVRPSSWLGIHSFLDQKRERDSLIEEG